MPHMRWQQFLSLGAAIVLGLTNALEARQAVLAAIRVSFEKASPYEPDHVTGPVLVGPQPALDLEWRLTNRGVAPMRIRPLAQVVRLRVWQEGAEVPVGTEFLDVPRAVGPDRRSAETAIRPGEILRVAGKTVRQDGEAFAPGLYRLRLEAIESTTELPPASKAPITFDTGYEISLLIQPLDSPSRVRQFHLLEAAFLRTRDAVKAVEHREALTKLPDATWLDRLALGEALGELGRHGAAVQVFRGIMPELSTNAAAPLLQRAGHLRRVAASFAAERDDPTAAALLRLEGVVPEAQIPSVVQRLRDRAPKPR